MFDVTSGKSFYGPGGMYGNFAGRDASRGLAKSSFDVEMIKTDGIDDLADLNEEELGTLKEWVEFFENKYVVVGELVDK